MLNPFETSSAPHEGPTAPKLRKAISRAEYQARRADLPENVRNYADRLQASILNFVSKYGVHEVSDLLECMESKRCRVPSVESGKLVKAINILHDVLERNELAGLTEVARAGKGKYFIVSEGKVFVVEEFIRQESDPEADVYEASECRLTPLHGEFFSLYSECGYVVGDGQAFAITSDGNILDRNYQPADVTSFLGFPPTDYSGGKWFRVGKKDDHVYVLVSGKKPEAPGSTEMVDHWSPIYGSADQEPLAKDVKIDKGRLYLLHVAKRAGKDIAKISDFETGAVLYDGPWDSESVGEKWQVSEGQAYIRRRLKDGGQEFYKNNELIFSLSKDTKCADWVVDKGVLHLTLHTGDESNPNVLYKLETPVFFDA